MRHAAAGSVNTKSTLVLVQAHIVLVLAPYRARYDFFILFWSILGGKFSSCPSVYSSDFRGLYKRLNQYWEECVEANTREKGFGKPRVLCISEFV